jgi:hypothetical protein
VFDVFWKPLLLFWNITLGSRSIKPSTSSEQITRDIERDSKHRHRPNKRNDGEMTRRSGKKARQESPRPITPVHIEERESQKEREQERARARESKSKRE